MDRITHGRMSGGSSDVGYDMTNLVKGLGICVDEYG